MPDQGKVLIVGGTSPIGQAIGAHYAEQGREVILTSRDEGRAQAAAEEIGGNSRGIALDLTRPKEIGDRLADLGSVARLVLVAVDRDENSVREFDIDGATNLATLKLIGYTEVIHALVDQLSDQSSIVLFGGLAKARPYPGSTTVTTVNGAVTSMIRTLAVELAPIRVNAIHPGVVGDSPYWEDKPAEVLENLRTRTPTGRLATTADVVDAVVFLLENGSMNAFNLNIDGGWLVT